MSLGEIFGGISAISTILLLVQVFLLKKQIDSEHDQTRRIKTIDIMLEWSKSIKRDTSYAEEIVKQLSIDQCRSLYSRKQFKVNSEIKQKLCAICHRKDDPDCEKCKNEAGEYLISEHQLTELRWCVISYLNMLETVMTAWQQNVVDKDIIEKQFVYLYNAEKGENALANFRAVAGGGSSYPVLKSFMEKLKANAENNSNIHEKKRV